jgi:glycosyltransferase involved in cell wall biosynthesis
MITLSVLVPTTTKRLNKYFLNTIEEINKQCSIINRNDVEILGLLDNYKMTIGEKRNNLLQMSRGNFVVFIDDDDRVTSDFLEQILNSIHQNPNSDCIVYDMICTIDGCRKIISKFGIEYEYTKLAPWTKENCSVKNEVPEPWFGKPSHNMVWKSSLAKSCHFPEKNVGEDFAWVAQAWPKIKTQARIDKVIYFYDAVLGKDY